MLPPKRIFNGMVLTGILFFSGCATVDSTHGSVVALSSVKMTEIEGFPIYEKPPRDRVYIVLGFVEIERPAGQKRERVLADLRAQALAMGGNAIIHLQSVVVPPAITPSVMGGVASRDFGQYGGAVLTEKFRWRGTVVLFQQ